MRAQQFIIPSGAPGPPGPRALHPPPQQQQLNQPQLQTQSQAQPQKLQSPPPQPSANVLSASNLQIQTDLLAQERSRSLQSQKAQLNAGYVQPLGSMSPDGRPPIHIKSTIGPEDLKLPPRKPKRPREPEPETPKTKETPKPLHKCSQSNCEGGLKGFETKGELEEHQKWHERERLRLMEEEKNNKWKIENPLDYYLSSMRGGLNLDSEGKPKGRGEEAKEDTPPKIGSTPQTKPASTPRLSTTPIHKNTGLTPAPGRSPATFKTPQLSNARTPGGKPTPNVKPPREEHTNEQLPTPPSSSAWEGSSMSPDVLRQCFDGLREQVSGLSTLNPAIFTPAYTPGASELEGGEGAEVVNGSFEDWNPFGYKDSMADDMLQDMEWESEPMSSFGSVGSKDWALAHGFELRI